MCEWLCCAWAARSVVGSHSQPLARGNSRSRTHTRSGRLKSAMEKISVIPSIHSENHYSTEALQDDSTYNSRKATMRHHCEMTRGKSLALFAVRRKRDPARREY